MCESRVKRNCFKKIGCDYFNYCQKCLKLVEEYLDVNNIKVNELEKSYFRQDKDYRKYLKKSREFREYQKNLGLKKVVDSFYDYRNRLFHGGSVSEQWTLEFDRQRANFIKIIEQLFFKILDINSISFYQVEYPHQRIFGVPNQQEEPIDLKNYIQKENEYTYEHYYKMLDSTSRYPTKLELIKTNHSELIQNYDALKEKLNTSFGLVEEFLQNSHPTCFFLKEAQPIHDINYQLITRERVDLEFPNSSKMIRYAYNEVFPFQVQNTDNESILTEFKGKFNQEDIRLRPTDAFFIVFQINPPYISFEFK
ncbi:MAG: hypothetical protein JW891_13680 [Candidatus Lokiarchaeota archaeon]|nr:hypothetical protein [Candidatus Lokiarchaeota archaeon]